MKKAATKLSIEELKSLHAGKRTAIRERLDEFAHITPDEYFYELVYCLLTPQSSAMNAEKAVRALQKQDFHRNDMDPEPILGRNDGYIRFHKTKAKHLRMVKLQFPLIRQHLMNGSPSVDLRTWLVNNVKGLGWKEASHFLRNVGHRNLAILDRHILRNLHRSTVIRSLPKTMTPKRYLAIEKKFRRFADSVAIPMDELDLLFWSMETGEILK